MKTKNFLRTALLMTLSVLFLTLTSCKKEDDVPDIASDLVKTYNGSMDVGTDGNIFSSFDYNVTVTKISNNRIKITPEDDNATKFEVDIKEGGAGTIVSNDSAITISFFSFNGVMNLSYNFVNSDDVAEQFVGTQISN